MEMHQFACAGRSFGHLMQNRLKPAAVLPTIEEALEEDVADCLPSTAVKTNNLARLGNEQQAFAAGLVHAMSNHFDNPRLCAANVFLDCAWTCTAAYQLTHGLFSNKTIIMSM